MAFVFYYFTLRCNGFIYSIRTQTFQNHPTNNYIIKITLPLTLASLGFAGFAPRTAGPPFYAEDPTHAFFFYRFLSKTPPYVIYLII